MEDKHFRIHEGSLLGFPVTPYTDGGSVDFDRLAWQIEVLLSYGAKAVFVGCGTGEIQCLSPDEHEQIVTAAVKAVDGRVPTFSAAGFGIRLAAELIERAARSGADGVLAFPPYLGGEHADSVHAYFSALAAESPLPLVIYQRDRLAVRPDVLARLAEHPRIVGLKDGSGQVDLLQRQVGAVTDPRFVFFNGTPTAELYAPALSGVGVASYSSALLNVVPEFAEAFNSAFLAGDEELTRELIRRVVVPFVEMRDRMPGYAVSLVKEGVNLRGGRVGPVRTPLPRPTPADRADLADWLESLGLRGPLGPKPDGEPLWSLPDLVTPAA